MRNADQRKYGSLMRRLRQDFSLDVDKCPNDAKLALRALNSHLWDEAYNKYKKNQEKE